MHLCLGVTVAVRRARSRREIRSYRRDVIGHAGERALAMPFCEDGREGERTSTVAIPIACGPPIFGMPRHASAALRCMRCEKPFVGLLLRLGRNPAPHVEQLVEMMRTPSFAATRSDACAIHW